MADQESQQKDDEKSDEATVYWVKEICLLTTKSTDKGKFKKSIIFQHRFGPFSSKEKAMQGSKDIYEIHNSLTKVLQNSKFYKLFAPLWNELLHEIIPEIVPTACLQFQFPEKEDEDEDEEEDEGGESVEEKMNFLAIYNKGKIDELVAYALVDPDKNQLAWIRLSLWGFYRDNIDSVL